MKMETRCYLGVTAFFIVIGLVYWFTSYENAGATMLAASALLGLLTGGYLLYQSRHMEPRPEDRPDATIAEGAGEVEEVPAPSIWPFVLAFGGTTFATGLAVGLAVALVRPLFLAIGAIGFVNQTRGPTPRAEE